MGVWVVSLCQDLVWSFNLMDFFLSPLPTTSNQMPWTSATCQESAGWFFYMICSPQQPLGPSRREVSDFSQCHRVRGQVGSWVQAPMPKVCSLPLNHPVSVDGLWWLVGFLLDTFCHFIPGPSFLHFYATVKASSLIPCSVPLYYLWPDCVTKLQHWWYQFPTPEHFNYFLKQVQIYQGRQSIRRKTQ